MYELINNKKLLSKLNDTNYKLLKFNEDINNCFLCSIIYPYISKDLNNLSSYEVNDTIEIFKKKINKVLKNKYKIKTTNITNNYLDKLSDLIGYNIAVFNKNFNNLSFMNSNKFDKTLYLITRNKDFFILVKSNKNIKLLLSNNLFKMKGGVKPPNKISPLNSIALPNTLPQILNRDGYYNNEIFGQWLKDSCQELIDYYTSNKEETNHIPGNKFKEIITAVYSNYFRVDLYNTISSINRDLRINEINAICIISGGDSFNNLMNDPDDRKISSDIDLKVSLQTENAINLYRIVQNNSIDQIKPEILKAIIRDVEIDTLKMKNTLYSILEQTVNNFNSNLQYKRDFNRLYNELYLYLRNHFGREIPILKKYKADSNNINKPLDLNLNNKSFLLRNNLRKKGIDQDLKFPFIMNDFALYCIDLKLDNEPPFKGIPGILDFVMISPENELIYNDVSVTNIDYVQRYNTRISVISADYYIQDAFKLISFGLRTQNRKFIKDIGRILQIIIKTNIINDPNIINNYIQYIVILLNNIKPNTNDEIDKYKEFRNTIEKIKQTYNLTGGAKSNLYDTKKKILNNNTLKNKTVKKNILNNNTLKNNTLKNTLDDNTLNDMDLNFSLNDYPLYNYYDLENEKMKEINNENTSLNNRNKNAQTGGTNDFKHINFYSLPKFLANYLSVCHDNDENYCLNLQTKPKFMKEKNYFLIDKKISFKPNLNFYKFTKLVANSAKYQNLKTRRKFIKDKYNIIKENSNYDLVLYNKSIDLFDYDPFFQWHLKNEKTILLNNMCIEIGNSIKYDKRNILMLYYFNRPDIISIFDFNQVNNIYSNELCKLIATNLLTNCHTLNTEAYINTLHDGSSLKKFLQKLLNSGYDGFKYLYDIIYNISIDNDINDITIPRILTTSIYGRIRKAPNTTISSPPKQKKKKKPSVVVPVPAPAQQ